MVDPPEAPAQPPPEPRPRWAERFGVSNSAISTIEPKHPAVRLAVRIALVVLVVGSLTFAIVKESDRIADINWRFSPGWLGLCLLSLVAFELCHIELWRLQMRVLGTDLEPRRARAIWSASLLARYVPTSMLMAVSRVALTENEGVAKRVTLASLVYEFALTFITSLGLAVYVVLQLKWFEDHEILRWLAIGLPVLGLISLHPAIFHRVADWGLKRMGRDPLPLSLGFTHVLGLAFLYACSYLVAGCSVLAMAHVLYPLGPGDNFAAIASYGLGYVAGVIAFVIPGSLGAREAGIALGLSLVMPAAVAVAVAIAVRLLQMGVEVLYGVVTPLLARRVDPAPAAAP